MKKKRITVVAVAILACLAAVQLNLLEASAGTIYVTSRDNSGTGTLREAANYVNANGGTNTISWITGSGGSIYLTSALSALNGNTTLDVTNSTTAVSISGADGVYMPLAGSVTMSNDNVSNPMTVSIVLSSTGSVTKTGDGVLYLTGTNTYTGGTFLNGGTVAIYGDSGLGNATGALSFNGGTLKIMDTVSMSRLITLNAGGGTFDTNSQNLTLSGVIDGSGRLTKTGLGTLYLNAANTYTGGTTVSSGTLQVGIDNGLPSSGAVSVGQEGTLALSDYAQAVASYSGSGTLVMKLSTAITNLDVAGTAALGGVLSLSFAPQLFTDGQTFTPITAGAITGQFSTILSPAALMFTPTYNAGSMVLTVSMIPFVNIADSGNQRAVGAALEPLRAAPTGDTATVLSNLYSLNAAPLRNAFDQISPSALSSMRGLVHAASDLQAGALRSRWAALGGAAPIVVDAASDEDMPGASQVQPDHVSYMYGSGFGFFVSALGAGGKVNQDADSPSYTLTNGGGIVGGDFRVGDAVALGAAVSYLSGRTDVTYPNTAHVDNRSIRYGVYGSGGGDDLRLNAYLGRAEDNFSTTRNVSFAEISRTASAKPRGHETNAYASASYDVFEPGWGVLAPIAEVNYDRVDVDAFTENGADSLDLAVDRQTSESLRSNIGGRFAASSRVGSCVASSYVSAGWRHEFKRQSDITATLAAGGGSFSTAVGNFGSDGLLAGLGVGLDWDTGLTVEFSYSGDFRSGIAEHAGNAALHWKF